MVFTLDLAKKNFMEKLANDTFSLWREEGRQSIQQNLEVFRSLVVQAKDFARRGQYDVAAVYAETAAFYAQFNHCGFFASRELEDILLTIGRQIKQTTLRSQEPALSKRPKNILHVSTRVSAPFSGIPRFIRRWMQQDTERSHSLALTKQAPDEVPKIFRELVSNSHGNIYLLNETIGGFVQQAKRLREIAATADMVVLHTWEHDVIATIAFANKEQSPPIIYANHGDHCFWLGASVTDVVANLRESGMRLSQKRRGIEAERNMLLPTILEPADRLLSRSEAKRQIGIDENSVLLLSIARAPKYRKTDGISFADAHVSLLKQHDRAILIIIGPAGTEDWSAAIEETQGRIIVLRETENTAIFYQAADIYVDSFPFVSITSLLEAGSYGVPLVSRYPYSSDTCEILGADMPGLTGNLIRVRNLEEYTDSLSRLIEDEEFRLALGEATKNKIAGAHWGSNWQRALENVYTCATTLRQESVPLAAPDQIFLGEPDVLLPSVHGRYIDVTLAMQPYLKFMPLTQRFYHWYRLVKKHGFRHRISLLLPEWLYLRFHSWKMGLKT